MEQEQARAPILRSDLKYRQLAGGNVFVHHPQIAAQVLDERAVAALRLCRGQTIAEMMPQVRKAMEYDCTEKEWRDFLRYLAGTGMFEGQPKRHPRVRMFDPGPALGFLTKQCRWLFTGPAVAGLFLLLFAGVWQLLSHWELFVFEVTRLTGQYPLPALFLYYLCFLPVGLLHELGHGMVCRWFGGEVLEVGARKDTANLYVLSNTTPLGSSRELIPYYAGGAFLDMFIFFVLVNVWLQWPNFVTLMFLLPQALFVLQFSYALEDASDLSKIVAQWTGIRDAGGRWAFVRQFLKERPRTAVQWKRAVIYLVSIALQGVVAGWLIWTFREAVPVLLWPGTVVKIRFWPPLLYLTYRLLRKALFDFRGLMKWFGVRSASAAG